MKLFCICCIITINYNVIHMHLSICILPSSSSSLLFGTKLLVTNISGNWTPGSKYIWNWKMMDIYIYIYRCMYVYTYIYIMFTDSQF